MDYKNFLINFVFYAMILGICVLALRFMFAYFFPFLIGILIAYNIQKPATALSKKIKINSEICAACLAVFVYVVLFLIIILAVWGITSNLNSIFDLITKQAASLKSYTQRATEFAKHIYEGGSMQKTAEKVISDTVDKFINTVTAFLLNSITSIIKNTPAFLLSTVVTVVATCYISKDYYKLKKFLRGVINEKTYGNIVTIKNIFCECILKFVAGYLILMLITFFELLAGLMILKIKNFFIIALLISIVDLLPILGTGTVMLPWALVLFLNNNYKTGLGMLLLFIIITVVRNFFEPKIIGDKIGLNPIFTLLAMFLGLKLAGIIGMLILPISLLVVYNFYRGKLVDS